MMVRPSKVTGRDALVALLRSGEPYETQCEVTRDGIVARYYAAGGDDAVGEIAYESPNIGLVAALADRITLGDESAKNELESFGAEFAGA